MEDQQKIDNALMEVNELPEKIPVKKWYRSKLIWANLLGIISILLQSHFGLWIPPEMQVMILSIINIVLRMITKEKIEWLPD